MTLERLATRVAEAQETQLAALDVAPDVRARLLRPTARRRPRWFVVAAAAALAVAALLVLRLRHPLGPVAPSFVVGASGETGRVGSWLAAPADAELRLAFSDGTAVTLSPASHARVDVLDARGAEISLENGRASVSVVHRDGCRWSLRAGPFDAAVTGTRFDLAWDPTLERFDLETTEGSVEVHADGVSDLRAVKAGETLRATHEQTRWTISSTRPESAVRADGSTPTSTSGAPAPPDPALAASHEDASRTKPGLGARTRFGLARACRERSLQRGRRRGRARGVRAGVQDRVAFRPAATLGGRAFRGPYRSGEGRVGGDPRALRR